MCEVFVEAGREQVQRTGESKPLCSAHFVDVSLEPIEPLGFRLPEPQAIALSRADAVRAKLAQQLVEEPVEIRRQATDIVQSAISFLLRHPYFSNPAASGASTRAITAQPP
jgi:hypothetical protein